jgi:hypothetical protein
MPKQSQEGDDAYAMQHRSKLNISAQTLRKSTLQNKINIVRQSQHERHLWKSQTECEPSQQMPDR